MLRTDIRYVNPDGTLTQAGAMAIQTEIDRVARKLAAAAAVADPTGGGTVDVQARAAIVAIKGRWHDLPAADGDHPGRTVQLFCNRRRAGLDRLHRHGDDQARATGQNHAADESDHGRQHGRPAVLLTAEDTARLPSLPRQGYLCRAVAEIAMENAGIGDVQLYQAPVLIAGGYEGQVLTVDEARPYFDDPTQLRGAMLESADDLPEDGFEYWASGPICGVFHPFAWPGVWMVHYAVKREDGGGLSSLRCAC